jgi:dihydrodipicolinate synthase/N-acetylneuraminate lyase
MTTARRGFVARRDATPAATVAATLRPMSRHPATIMVSCVVPWTIDEEIDEPRFRAQVDAALAAGYRHVYIFGTAGEGYAVDTRRFREVAELFRATTDQPGIQAMVGVIGLSTATVIERIGIAYDLGFRAFQLSLPRWDVLRDPEVGTFFREVCGAFPDSIFMHYNTARVGRILGADDYRRFIDDVPNLVATKMMTSDMGLVGRLVAEVPELQHFLTEPMLGHGAIHGECSLLGTFGLLAPQRSWAMFHAAQEGRIHEAVAIGQWFRRLSEEVFAPAMVDPRIDGTYDKAIVRLGPIPDFPLRMLSPYRWLRESEVEQCRAILRERFPDCA